ncbi:PGF-pre-PGF domain-containing protein [Methanococcoides methylutens]|nr:PGF-pre-PGF domain-containing protein [Methanococcoides methylutens]
MKIGEDDSYVYFEAETPGFSPFAIAADVEDGSSINTDDPSDDIYDSDNAGASEEEPTTDEPNGIPGISPVTSILILVFACIFRKGKN